VARRGNVKGASFLRTCEAVHGFVEQGLISRDALEVQLSADALRLLEQKVEPSLWYPLDAVDELSRLLVDFEGEGDPRYMCTVGERSLHGLLERDTFRNFIEGAMLQIGNEGPTLIRLAGLIYDFGCWTFEGDDLREFVVTLDEAGSLPEIAPHTICGFMEALVAHCSDHRVRVTLDRPSRDRVIFRAAPVA
jgi:hypothetical protein